MQGRKRRRYRQRGVHGVALDPASVVPLKVRALLCCPSKGLMQEVRKEGPHRCLLSLSLLCPGAALGRERAL